MTTTLPSTDRQPELQEALEALMLTKHAQANVYFQPPVNLVMNYPAIVYHLDYSDNDYADNRPYRRHWRYLVTLISRDPNDPVREALADLPMCRFSRFYTANNLNHTAFNLYF